ncbi:hypothetical protein Tco_1450957, partial [Tanacetum coccineum]
MIRIQTLFLLSITYLLSIICQIPNNCNQSCPGSEFTQVPYPFGFSSGWEIQLNCTSNGTVSIGEFPVWQFSSDALLVNLTTKCGRNADALSLFYSGNYAPISKNAIVNAKDQNSIVMNSDKDQVRVKRKTLEAVLDQCQKALELLSTNGFIDDNDDDSSSNINESCDEDDGDDVGPSTGRRVSMSDDGEADL